MSKVLKFGWVRGGREGVEKAVSNSQYFNRRGGAFVAASGPAGVKMVTASTDVIMGWAEVPKANNATQSYWKSSTTAAADKVFVITDPTAIFVMPVLEARASLNASLIGYPVCASAAGATTTLKQYADAKQVTAAAGSAQLECIDVDTTNKYMYVRMNPTQRL